MFQNATDLAGGADRNRRGLIRPPLRSGCDFLATPQRIDKSVGGISKRLRTGGKPTRVVINAHRLDRSIDQLLGAPLRPDAVLREIGQRVLIALESAEFSATFRRPIACARSLRATAP